MGDREPCQVRKEAALSDFFHAPRGCLPCGLTGKSAEAGQTPRGGGPKGKYFLKKKEENNNLSDEVKKKIIHRIFDGMIITGAPVEKMNFDEVNYWKELSQIMEWSKTHITSTLHICWAAQAGLYYHYGVKKVQLEKKLSGIYRHHVMNKKEPLVRGFDDFFMAPHSLYTEACREDILNNPELKVLADSKEAGIYIVMAQEGKQIFVMGHPEYDRMTLDQEYKRDVKKGIMQTLPVHYYPDDDPTQRLILSWRSHANNLYTNWLNYYVYQSTPYEWH